MILVLYVYSTSSKYLYMCGYGYIHTCRGGFNTRGAGVREGDGVGICGPEQGAEGGEEGGEEGGVLAVP